MRFLLSILCVLGMLLNPAVQAQEAAQAEQAGCPTVKVDAERMPDLNIPRSGHTAFVANGEVTVVGGHTSGFVLTPTAEYFKDGQWHLLHTVYAHDGGFYVKLKSGKVLLAGGFKENLGIGQSYEVEMYDPNAHHFDGFGCLDQKRASATAIELDSGRVLITGNWYADDGMELFNGHDRFNHLKPILQPRYLPQLFRTSDGDVMMVGGSDYKGQPLDTLIVERMKGEPFRDPFFDTWRPLHLDLPINSDNYFIGDTDKGDYAYLMPVKNNNGEVAIAEVRDTVFSLLPTDHPVPTASQWGCIDYYTPFYADRPHQRGYIMACDSTGHQYALCVDYAKKPARLTLYHTDPLTDVYTLTVPVMTADGNLMLTGIKPAEKYNFNFTPTPKIWLLRLNGKDSSAPVKSMNFWLWVFMALAVVAILVLIYWRHRRTGMSIVESKGTVVNDELMGRISQVMEEQRPYLNSRLRLSDLAALLDVSQNDISACINTQKGCSFSTFINGYRIDYAKQLLISQPDMKISHVATESGFTSEQTFHTNFKQITGMTPRQWLSQTAESTKEL